MRLRLQNKCANAHTHTPHKIALTEKETGENVQKITQSFGIKFNRSKLKTQPQPQQQQQQKKCIAAFLFTTLLVGCYFSS